GTKSNLSPETRTTPKTRMLTLYLRYCSLRSSGISRSSRTALRLNSSPVPYASLPSDENDAILPSTASFGVSSCTSTNWPCIGMLWNRLWYGSTRSAWNSRPPCWKPRKIPTTCSRGNSWMATLGVPPLGGVLVIEEERVEREPIGTQVLPDTVENEVL